jgi:hypothetical protein
MASLKTVRVWFRANYLPTPDPAKKAAALFALVASPKGDRMFIHNQRHMSFPTLNTAKATVKDLDAANWSEVVYRDWSAFGTIVLKDTGEVIHPGYGNVTAEFNQNVNNSSAYALPDVKELETGWAL